MTPPRQGTPRLRTPNGPEGPDEAHGQCVLDLERLSRVSAASGAMRTNPHLAEDIRRVRTPTRAGPRNVSCFALFTMSTVSSRDQTGRPIQRMGLPISSLPPLRGEFSVPPLWASSTSAPFGARGLVDRGGVEPPPPLPGPSPPSKAPPEPSIRALPGPAAKPHAYQAWARRELVGRGGVEPPTSRLSGVRSNHLSYRPNPIRRTDRPQARALAGLLGHRTPIDRRSMVEPTGIEPVTPCLQSRCSPS